MKPPGAKAIAFFPPRNRFARNTAIGLLLTAMFSLMCLIPAEEQPMLHYAPVVAVPLFVYVTLFSALYALVQRPSLVLDSNGMCYRISPFRNVLVPWPNISRVAVETSSSNFRGKTLRSTFISVYLKEEQSVVTQMPILTRVFSWISVQMGYAPLFISAAMVDEPLEDVVEVMRKFARSAIDVL